MPDEQAQPVVNRNAAPAEFKTRRMAKEIKQKTFVLRIDSRRMEAIEKWAADEFRSVNGQLLYIIDQALKKSRRMQNEGGAISPPDERGD